MPFPELESVQTIQNLFLHYICGFISHFFLEHLKPFETNLNCTLVIAWNYYVDCQTTKMGFRTPATSKMDLFVTIFDNFHSLTIVTKISILDAAGVFHPTLITDVFTSQLDLNQLKPIFPLYRNRSINSDGKEDGWLLWDGNILISNSLRKQLCT